MRYETGTTVQWDDDSYDAFHDYSTEALSSFIRQYEEGGDHIKWYRIPSQLLISIWNYFGKHNMVRNVKGLEKIKDRLLRNIAALYVGNLLNGHSSDDPIKYINDELELNWDDEKYSKFLDFFHLENGQDLISDYGLPFLIPLFVKLYNTEEHEEVLYICDRILNVVHQRSDLAEFFIEGGSATLNKVKE